MAADGNTVSGNGRAEEKRSCNGLCQGNKKGQMHAAAPYGVLFLHCSYAEKSSIGTNDARMHSPRVDSCMRTCIHYMHAGVGLYCIKHQASSISFGDADLMQKLHTHWI